MYQSRYPAFYRTDTNGGGIPEADAHDLRRWRFRVWYPAGYRYPWDITVPPGLQAAFIRELPVLTVYFLVELNEIVKLSVGYKH